MFFVKDVAACERFYVECLGFAASDRYPGKGAFLRCSPNGGHHDIFLLQRPAGVAALNHVAFRVRDIREVFGGDMHISRCGWETQLGPGRHPVSSAYFWYFRNPAGALIEYYADEDQLTADWQPREFDPGPTVFAEWAMEGGIDGNTRRQDVNIDPPLPLNMPDELTSTEYSNFLCYAEWKGDYRYALDNVMDPMLGTFLHKQSHSMAEGESTAKFQIRATDTGFVFEKTGQHRHSMAAPGDSLSENRWPGRQLRHHRLHYAH